MPEGKHVSRVMFVTAPQGLSAGRPALIFANDTKPSDANYPSAIIIEFSSNLITCKNKGESGDMLIECLKQHALSGGRQHSISSRTLRPPMQITLSAIIIESSGNLTTCAKIV